jgi:magnesium chelatase subunit D
VRSEYPFSAVVGQDELKLALLLSAVDPTIGGVLIKGERGTAKTTIARGLAALLPPKADGARAPFVELPLGATEDRVVGSLDVTKALREGHTQLRSGVLARANGGVLYVDEVNLLPDHLVDLLLDAAASGWVTVERDGVSAGEPARFVLVGTMNPEEGDLRPQFLDRFGLSVQVRGLDTQELRMAAVSKRLEFDADPTAVIDAAHGAEDELRQAIVGARARLALLPVTAAHLTMVTAICSEQSLDGIRGDLAIIKAARAVAAWEKATEIGADHVRRAAAFALPHRIRRRSVSATATAVGAGSTGGAGGATKPPPSAGRYGPDTGVPPSDALASADAKTGASLPGAATAGSDGAGPGSTANSGAPASAQSPPPADASAVPTYTAAAGTPSGIGRAPRTEGTRIDLVTDVIDPEAAGRRGSGSVAARRSIRAVPYNQTGTLAINETLTGAVVRGRRVEEGNLALSTSDLMQHERSGPGRSHVLFLVDASASMATQRRLELAKHAVLGLLQSNYERRDEVALMIFRGEGSDVVVPFTADVGNVEGVLNNVPTGGRTPLARALVDATQLIRTRSPALLVLFTDGRANVSGAGGDPWQESLIACAALKTACAAALVVDCEAGLIVLGRARQLASELGADCISLNALQGNDLTLQVLRRIEVLQ